MSENKENKKVTEEVTNEKLLEHLKEIEFAQSCILNGINMLFSIIDSKSELLKMNDKECRNLSLAIVSTASQTEHMMKISGVEKEMEERKHELNELKEFLKNLLDY